MFHVPLPEHLVQKSRRESVLDNNDIDSEVARRSSINQKQQQQQTLGEPDSPVEGETLKYPKLSQLSLSSVKSPQNTTTEDNKYSSQDDVPEPLRKLGIRFKKVPVKPTDSVISIAVRNGISDHDLRRFNRKLIFDYCEFVEFVWVPENPNMVDQAVAPQVTDEANRKYLARRQFCMQTGAEENEASFYLDESNFDVKKAINQWNDDMKWEREQQSLRLRPTAAARNKSSTTTTATTTTADVEPSAPSAVNRSAYHQQYQQSKKSDQKAPELQPLLNSSPRVAINS